MQNHPLGIHSDKIWPNPNPKYPKICTSQLIPPIYPIGQNIREIWKITLIGRPYNESTSRMDGPLLSFKIHVVALKVHLLFNWRQIDATVKINLTEKLKRCSQSIFNEGQKSLEGRFLGSLLTTFTVGICPKTHRDPWWLTFSLVGHSANINNK